MCLVVSTSSVPGRLTEKLEAIAAAGFDAVELFEPDLTGAEATPLEIGRLVRDLGLKICLLQPFHDLECQPPADRARSFDRLERKFDLMQELGTDLLMVGSASGPQTVPDFGRARDDLGEAAERAKSRAVRLAYLGLPWAMVNDTDQRVVDIVEQVDSPSLGFALNSFFSLADGSKPAQLRTIPGDKLFHVQLSDAPRLHVDIRRLKRHFGLLPGLGALNLAGFIRVLNRAGYRGPWSIARSNELGPQPSGDTLLRDSFRSLVNLLDDVARQDPEFDFPIPDLPERVHASGFEFLEFAVDEKNGAQLAGLLSAMCFRKERRHVSKPVTLWRQGAINIVINTDSTGHAGAAFQEHGPTVCDMALRVKDAAQTARRATMLGAPEFSQPVGAGELNIPAVRGVGGNVVHFIDEVSDLHRVWDIEFEPVARTQAVQPAGLRRIDHLAQTMRQDDMQSWLLYYISTFDMAKSPIVNVSDPAGIVRSQAIESPEGEVRLNLNGAVGQNTMAASFLDDSLGAGVQHVAFQTDDIFETSQILERAGFPRLKIPGNYYADLAARFGLDADLVERLQAHGILYDRDGPSEYFQIFSQPIFHGFFFEIVERRLGYQGYGARNASIRLAAQKKLHETGKAGVT